MGELFSEMRLCLIQLSITISLLKEGKVIQLIKISVIKYSIVVFISFHMWDKSLLQRYGSIIMDIKNIDICLGIEKDLWNRIKLSPPWKYFIAFGIFAIGSLILTFIWNNKIIHLFESFYRYGYLVIGFYI